MGSETLILAMFASLTIIAYMIAINARGLWRLTLSFLLATCMLGGTVWLVILQYSTSERTRYETERREMKELLQDREQALLAKKEHMSSAARVSYLVTQANGFAAMLQREKLQDPGFSHEQLVARAIDTEQRLEMLQAEINSYKSEFVKFPETFKFVAEAMAELKEACRLYRVYYFAETTAVEQATERQLRQRAKKAQSILAKAEDAIVDDDEE